MLKTVIHNMSGFSPSAQELLLAAAKNKEIVENSEIFKEKFLAINTFMGETSKWYFRSTQEIFDHYMLGKETVGNVKDNVADYYLVPYYSWRRVVGYTYPTDNRIYLNTRVLNGSSLMDIGSNMAHEYCHNIGFDHAFRGASMYNSIPYMVNKVFEESYAEIFDGEVREPVVLYTPWYTRVFRAVTRWF